MQFTADDSDHVHELQRLLAVTADTYNSLVEQVTHRVQSSLPHWLFPNVQRTACTVQNVQNAQ